LPLLGALPGDSSRTLWASLACDSGRKGASTAAPPRGVHTALLAPPPAAQPTPGMLLLGDGGWLAVRRSSGVSVAAPAAAAAVAGCACAAASWR
jgi:hypothetical protein